MAPRPADIPRLLDAIRAYHDSLKELSTVEAARRLSDEQKKAMGELNTASTAFAKAMMRDYRNGEGEIGEKFVALLVKYYNDYIGPWSG